MSIEDEMMKSVAKMGKDMRPDIKKASDKLAENVITNQMMPKEALGMQDETVEHMYAQGYQLYNMGKYEDAKNMFITLTLLNVAEPKYLLGLAATEHMMKEYEAAAGHYIKCGMFDVESPIPFFHASDCYMQIDDIRSAMLMLQMVINRSEEREEYATMKDRASLTLETLKEKIKQGDMTTKEKSRESSEDKPELETK